MYTNNNYDLNYIKLQTGFVVCQTNNRKVIEVFTSDLLYTMNMNENVKKLKY